MSAPVKKPRKIKKCYNTKCLEYRPNNKNHCAFKANPIYCMVYVSKKGKAKMRKMGDMFELALKRPANYQKLNSDEQWEIDKMLDILDWDGSCPHNEGAPCRACEERYRKRG